MGGDRLFSNWRQPCRKEQTTGEINYRNVFSTFTAKAIAACWDEHGIQTGKEGEIAVIEAYKNCDDFEFAIDH
jgi:hypothetical protein